MKKGNSTKDSISRIVREINLEAEGKIVKPKSFIIGAHTRKYVKKEINAKSVGGGGGLTNLFKRKRFSCNVVSSQKQ